MPGLEMPARGGGAAMLRDLRDEERPDADVLTSVSTDARNEASTDAHEEARESASAEVSKPASQDGSTRARKAARPQARTALRQDVRPPLREEASADVLPDFLEGVEAALASREPLTGGVKATVDMSPELSTRAKRYLADHRGQNTRQVLIALFDAFLSAKGY